MQSESQRIEKLQKMSRILSTLKECSNINEVSEITNIPTSTIQRYLNRLDYYQELSDEGLLKRENIEKAFNYSRKWLEKAKKEGLSRGGTTSQEKYGFKKNEDGKFNGHTR